MSYVHNGNLLYWELGKEVLSVHSNNKNKKRRDKKKLTITKKMAACTFYPNALRVLRVND